MNLKEAFRYQNVLSNYIYEGQNVLLDSRNTVNSKRTVLHSKIDPNLTDETILEDHPFQYGDKITDLICFIRNIIEQKQELSAIIRETKKSLNIDIDDAVAINQTSRNYLDILLRLKRTKAKNKLIKNNGRGYRFNADGNQIIYNCDEAIEETPNYDMQVVADLCSRMSAEADERSAEIDKQLILTEIDYEPAYDMNDSFIDAFEKYLNR